MSDVLHDIPLRQDQRVGLGRGRDDVEFVLRIELAQGLDRQVDRRGDLPQVHQFVDPDGVHRKGNRGFGRLDAVLAVVGVGVRRADEGRHVAARLAGQVVVNLPEVLASRAGDRFVDVARAAVVGGDGQRPVVINGEEVFQVAAGGLRGAVGVAAFVDQRVDFESVALAGRGHELPQPDGAHRRHRRGGERRFDDRQRAQLDGKAFAEQLLLDDREVVLRHAEDAADRAVARVGVAVDVALYDAVVGELDRRREVEQPPGVDRVGRAVGHLGGVLQNVLFEKFAERVLPLAFAPCGQQRVGLFGGESQRHVVDDGFFGRGGFRLGDGNRFGLGNGRRDDGFGFGFLVAFLLAGAAVEGRRRSGDGKEQRYGKEFLHRLKFQAQIEAEHRAVAPEGGDVGVVDQRFEVHREVVRNVVVLEVGVDMRIDDLQDVQRTREDDAEVAVAPVVVAQVADERGRIASVELVGRSVGVFVGIAVVVAQQIVGLFETLVAAVVPVDAVDHRGESADDERHFPVAFVVDLSRSGEDAGQRGGLLDARHVVGRVAHGRVADEVDVRGDRDPQVNLTPRVAADHLGLEGVQLGRAREVHVGIGLELALERLVGLVFVDVQSQSGSHQSVEDRQFPVLFVVNLSVAGDHGRNPAHLRERHRVAHKPAFFVNLAFGRGVHAPLCGVEARQGQRVEVMQVVGAQVRDGRRVGGVFGGGDRVDLPYEARQAQRIAPALERIRFFEQSAADDRACAAVELRPGGQSQRKGCDQEQESEPDCHHIF